MSAAFDTLKYAKQLKQAGVPENQAEIHAEALRGVIEEQIMARFDRVDEELQGIKEGGVRLEGKFIKLEGRVNLLQWMVGFNLALTAAVLWMLIRA